MTKPRDWKPVIVSLFNDCHTAEMYRRAYAAIPRPLFIIKSHYMLCLAATALWEDMLTRLMRVLDQHGEALGLATLLDKADPVAIEQAVADTGVDLDHLDAVGQQLRLVRNKIQFHVTPRGVAEPNKIWEEAGLTGDDIRISLQSLLRFFSALHVVLGGRALTVTPYDASDVPAVFGAYNQSLKPTR